MLHLLRHLPKPDVPPTEPMLDQREDTLYPTSDCRQMAGGLATSFNPL